MNSGLGIRGLNRALMNARSTTELVNQTSEAYIARSPVRRVCGDENSGGANLAIWGMNESFRRKVGTDDKSNQRTFESSSEKGCLRVE